MNPRRSFVLTATTLVVAVAALATSVRGADASAPPTTAAPDSSTTAQPVDDDPTDQITESWTLAPAAQGEGGNRPNLSYLADPGSTIDDSITVYNFGNVPENFQIYSTDAFNDDQGQFAVLPGDKKPVDVGTWVTFPQQTITVLPGQQVTMPISIRIPADATPGDHAGAILASSPTQGTTGQGQVITLDRRTGTRLYVRVKGPLFPELGVTNLSTTYHKSANPLGGSATVTFRVENRGNVRLTGTPTVSVGGVFGIGEKKVTLPDVTDLLPGEDVVLTAELKSVPALMFEFTKVRIEPDDSSDAKAATAKKMTFAPPVTILIVVLLVLIVVLARRHRRRRDSDRLTPTEVLMPTERERQPT